MPVTVGVDAAQHWASMTDADLLEVDSIDKAVDFIAAASKDAA